MKNQLSRLYLRYSEITSDRLISDRTTIYLKSRKKAMQAAAAAAAAATAYSVDRILLNFLDSGR